MTALTAAQDYIRRGWNPVPIPFRTKFPIDDGWQLRVINDANVASHFNGTPANIGVILGPTSGGLTDIDCDCREAIALAPVALPKTGAIFGRASARAAHWLYRTGLSGKIEGATVQFRDPRRKNKSMIAELRIGPGAQTVFPGSTHKDTGEDINWDADGEPAIADDDDLHIRVRRLAALSLLARYWPAEGSRHGVALVVGGFLARAGIAPTLIKYLVQAVARAAGDEESADRFKAAGDAAKAHERGDRSAGLPRMVEFFGQDIVDRCVEWLGYDDDYPDVTFNEVQATELPKMQTPAAWWREPATIPPRQWLYGGHYIRKRVGATIGAGGRAKTTQGIFEGVSMACGREIAAPGKPNLPSGPLRVWVLNGEEDQDELDRRVAACCQKFGVTRDELGDRLFVQSVAAAPLRIVGLHAINGRPVVNVAVVDYVESFIKANKIDVVMIDPLISFHNVMESDNSHMDVVCKEAFGGIAERTNSAIELFHHPGKPKPGAIETTVEDSRGASAVIWAVRSARVFNFMTPADATKLGIADDIRRGYIRISNGKANMGPTGSATWVRIEVEQLSNGDDVACTSPWKPENPFKTVTTADMHECRRLAQTGACRADSRSPDWFGYVVAAVLKMDVTHGGDNKASDVAKIKAIIKRWLQTKALKVERREDKNRQERDYIVPGPFDDDAAAGDTFDEDGVVFD
jgi:hypothetical protein